MRVDQLILRAAAAALLLLSLVVVLAAPGDVLDLPVEQLLLGEGAWVVRVVAAAAGALVVLSAATVGRALDPERGRRAVPILLGIVGLALLGFAVTTPNEVVVSGGTIVVLVETTPSGSGAANTLALLLVSTLLPAAMIVQAARWRRADASSREARVAFGVAVVSLWASLASSLAEQGTLPAPGLWERVALVVAWVGLAVLLLRLAGRPTSGSAGTRT